MSKKILIATLILLLSLSLVVVRADIIVPWYYCSGKPCRWDAGDFPLPAKITGGSAEEQGWVKDGMDRWGDPKQGGPLINKPCKWVDGDAPKVTVELVDKIEKDGKVYDGWCDIICADGRIISAKIQIRRGIGSERTGKAASHEFGHGIGYNDNDGPTGKVMKPVGPEWPPSSEEVTTLLNVYGPKLVVPEYPLGILMPIVVMLVALSMWAVSKRHLVKISPFNK